MNIFYTYINRRLPTSSFERYLEGLPEAACLKIRRFHRWQDAQASLLGLLLLGDGLTALGFDGRQLVKKLEYDSVNKPQLLPGLADFNISHAGDLVVCAISRDSQLGVDIEKKQYIAIEDFDNCWCREEIRWLYRQDDRTSAFFHLWTRKEAVIKAFGKGLSFDLKAINVLDEKVVTGDNGTWTLHPFYLHHSYCAHIAFNRDTLPGIRIRRLAY